MEARRTLVLIVVLSGVLSAASNAQAQNSYKAVTQNFVVYSPDPQLTKQVAKKAEQYRKELAIEWLGSEMPAWREKCPIQVQIGRHAGGETSFAFVNSGRGKSEPTSWSMKIFGPPDRLVDAVLPHEVTHTIFATYFGRPLPRWADEGACTTVEHESERKKNHQMLIDFLTSKPSRGIPFNRMFTMKEYPRDILPLYAQGYSLAKFLIMKHGRRHFIDYVEAGMNAEMPGRETRAWNQITDEFYGYKDLSDLQIEWLKWVRDGSLVSQPAPHQRTPESNVQLATTQPNTPQSARPVRQASFENSAPSRLAQATHQPAASQIGNSWYARQMRSADRQFTGVRKASSEIHPVRDSRRETKTIWR